MDKTLYISALVFLLAGCGEEPGARKAVLAHLKDPDSAKFGEFSLAGKNGACLTVNAKNSMGGYTGDQQAALCKLAGKWVSITIERASHEKCLEIVGRVCNKYN